MESHLPRRSTADSSGPPSPPSSFTPMPWQPPLPRRVVQGGLAGFAVGAAYATFRALPPSSALKAGVACGALAAPFFALREVVSVRMRVDGPVASAIAGGFAGYFGALFIAGPRWRIISQGAMATGLGCGLADVAFTALDWRRKAYLVSRQNANAAAAREALQPKNTDPAAPSNVAIKPQSWFRIPIWFTALKNMDDEYEELLRRKEATAIALEEEQARIALLLEALETVKAGEQGRDAELAEGNNCAAVEPGDPSSSSDFCR